MRYAITCLKVEYEKITKIIDKSYKRYWPDISERKLEESRKRLTEELLEVTEAINTLEQIEREKTVNFWTGKSKKKEIA